MAKKEKAAVTPLTKDEIQQRNMLQYKIQKARQRFIEICETYMRALMVNTEIKFDTSDTDAPGVLVDFSRGGAFAVSVRVNVLPERGSNPAGGFRYRVYVTWPSTSHTLATAFMLQRLVDDVLPLVARLEAEAEQIGVIP